jgi:hypothetical protein
LVAILLSYGTIHITLAGDAEARQEYSANGLYTRGLKRSSGFNRYKIP